MNYKKIFFSVLIVALAATICVGFASCNEDIPKPPPADRSHYIISHWGCLHDMCKGYYIIFNENSTYSYGNPHFGTGVGNYKILATLENQEVRTGNGTGEPKKCTLFILEVTPNDVFDQIWVYHWVEHSGAYTFYEVAVEYYSKGTLLPDDFLFALSDLSFMPK